MLLGRTTKHEDCRGFRFLNLLINRNKAKVHVSLGMIEIVVGGQVFIGGAAIYIILTPATWLFCFNLAVDGRAPRRDGGHCRRYAIIMAVCSSIFFRIFGR